MGMFRLVNTICQVGSLGGRLLTFAGYEFAGYEALPFDLNCHKQIDQRRCVTRQIIRRCLWVEESALTRQYATIRYTSSGQLQKILMVHQ